LQVRRACILRDLPAIFASGLDVLRQLGTTAKTTRTDRTCSTSTPRDDSEQRHARQKRIASFSLVVTLETVGFRLRWE